MEGAAAGLRVYDRPLLAIALRLDALQGEKIYRRLKNKTQKDTGGSITGLP